MTHRTLPLALAALAVIPLGIAGSASAAALIGSAQVKDGSLTGVDLAPGTVRSSDVRDGSLMPRDFGVLPKGPQGATGRDGDPGAPGSPGLTVVPQTPTVDANATTTYTIPCMAPQKAVFGGAALPPDVSLRQSAPEFDFDQSGNLVGTGWDFVIRNRDSAAQPITLQVFCVTAR